MSSTAPSRPGNYVGVLLGNGAGGFSSESHFPAGQTPRSVAVGNFNGDVFPDIAAANISSASVSILLGKGDGTFGEFKPYRVSKAASSGPNSVAVGSLNGDRWPDLALTKGANGRRGGVAVLLGKGDGSFRALRAYPAGTKPSSVAIGNFNAGSHPDLAVTNSGSNNASILLNAGPSHRTLTLSYRAAKHRFTGRLTSPDPTCIGSQRVRVLRRRSGPDRQVGSAISAPNGTYRIGHSANPGTYYARVRAWSACRRRPRRRSPFAGTSAPARHLISRSSRVRIGPPLLVGKPATAGFPLFGDAKRCLPAGINQASIQVLGLRCVEKP